MADHSLVYMLELKQRVKYIKTLLRGAGEERTVQKEE